MKKACRAKEPERIWPNVFTVLAAGAATAKFEWADGGQPFSGSWQDGTTGPAALSHIAVFDAHCARVFIDEQAAISYVPYGMDLLTQVSDALQAIQKRLMQERQDKAFDRSQLSGLRGATEVGRLIDNLSRATKPEDVQKLANLSQQETADLQSIKNQMQADMAQKMAQELRQFCIRLEALTREFGTLSAALSDETVGRLRASFQQLRAAYDASQVASRALAEGCLPGTGSEPWERLLHSAIEFAKLPYSGSAYPGPDGASCVLCQQPLSDSARHRIEHFLAFLQEDAQAKYRELRASTAQLYQPLVQTQVPGFPSDKAFLTELEEKVPGSTQSITQYVNALEERRARIQEMAPSREITELPPLPDSPEQLLVALRERLLKDVEALTKGLTPEQCAHMAKRLEELGARVRLQPLVPLVLAAIKADDMDWKLGEAIKCCNTAALSRKGAELYQLVVTVELQEALKRELAQLGVQDIALQLDLAGQRGRTVQQLRLVTANQSIKGIKPSEILSEGEQRAIALASFLAEVGLEPGESGIVFDDPVTSLDHHRRELIAARLAKEAKRRQVIVFTHDLAFAYELIESAKRQGQKWAVRHVFASRDVKGRCDDKLPFEAQKIATRIQELKELCRKADAAFEESGDYEAFNDSIRSGYRKLRDSWELLVEENLFAGTVKRFRRPIQTQRLRSVRVEDQHVKAIYDGMTRTSMYTHEGGVEAPPTLPTIPEFLQDIEALQAALKSVEETQRKAKEDREKLGIPSGPI
ncbi:AAA family ATPase [Variovorax ureilyticus]|uniref:AAA family ATPase n=1 Tax=Variovorax ureilyticus TaxID=1836198 RepID=UPI003D665785